MRVILLIVWLLAFATSFVRAEEPPRELTPERPLHRSTFTDAKSVTRSVDARVLLEAQDGGLLLEARDGRLWNVTPKQLQKHERTDTEFRPLSAKNLVSNCRVRSPSWASRRRRRSSSRSITSSAQPPDGNMPSGVDRSSSDCMTPSRRTGKPPGWNCASRSFRCRPSC